MLIRDRHVDPTAKYPRQLHSLGLNPAISLTNGVIGLIKAEHARKILAAAVYCRALVGNVALKLVVAPQTGLLAGTTLAISATAEKFKTITTTAVYLVSKAVKTKAATDNLVFSANDTINNAGAAGLYWGAWRVQVNGAGAVSTVRYGADQAFATEAAAIAAMPAADADKVSLGYITVKTKTTAVKWTANTDDLTPASDCGAANFYSDVARECLTGAIAAVALTDVDGVVASDADLSKVIAEDGEMIAILCTSDGTGALTDGRMALWTRAARVFRGE